MVTFVAIVFDLLVLADSGHVRLVGVLAQSSDVQDPAVFEDSRKTTVDYEIKQNSLTNCFRAASTTTGTRTFHTSWNNADPFSVHALERGRQVDLLGGKLVSIETLVERFASMRCRAVFVVAIDQLWRRRTVFDLGILALQVYVVKQRVKEGKIRIGEHCPFELTYRRFCQVVAVGLELQHAVVAESREILSGRLLGRLVRFFLLAVVTNSLSTLHTRHWSSRLVSGIAIRIAVLVQVVFIFVDFFVIVVDLFQFILTGWRRTCLVELACLVRALQTDSNSILVHPHTGQIHKHKLFGEKVLGQSDLAVLRGGEQFERA